MCTAISYKTKAHYFGRNLDLERGYNEGVVITPRKVMLPFRHIEPLLEHYALIGMATVVDGYPLYFEATNEKGLSMAGLNFPGNAFYPPYVEGKVNIAPFELILYFLGLCDSVQAVKKLIRNIHIVHTHFSERLPASPLHWMISDSEVSIVLECTKAGLQIYENPYGVLTNNPTFDFHLSNINQYMGMHAGVAENEFSAQAPMQNFSLGLGAFGLPGDFSSASRFVKATFVKEKSVCDGSEAESVNQFFHILRSVAMPKGCVKTADGAYEYTRYSCCCNTQAQVYYYTTYENATVRKVAMHSADLSENHVFFYPMEA
ncbi:MAG: choloylglycine hydrolase [Clostridia bacterium]|nr:choloylglycine hydrolase [Clostridia bacterium]